MTMSESESQVELPEDETAQTKGKQKMNAPANIKSPLAELRAVITRQLSEFKLALPRHIDVEHFERVAWTYVPTVRDILNADRRSIGRALMEAAQDGLLPDGKEGVIVVYGNKATWQPGYRGWIKLARNSGQLAAIVARVVYPGDRYRYWVDEDGEHLLHEPCDNPDLTRPLRVYCMAKTKDGELFIEPMPVKEIEKVRAISKTGYDPKGPWTLWWEEMAKKTVIKRLLSKRFPTSANDRLYRAMERDDEYGDMKTVKAVEVEPEKKPAPLKTLEDFGNGHGKEEKPKRGRKPKSDVRAQLEGSLAVEEAEAQEAEEEESGGYTSDEGEIVEGE